MCNKILIGTRRMKIKSRFISKTFWFGFLKVIFITFGALFVLSMLNNGSALDTIALRMPTSLKSFSIHPLSWLVLAVFVTDIMYAFMAANVVKYIKRKYKTKKEKYGKIWSGIFIGAWIVGSILLVTIYYFANTHSNTRSFTWADLLNIYYTLAFYAVLFVAFLILELIIEWLYQKISFKVESKKIFTKDKTGKFKVAGFKGNGTVFPKLNGIDRTFENYKEDFSFQEINLEEFCNNFCKYLWKNKKYYTLATVQAFVSALANTRFIILRGNHEDVNCTDLPKFFAKFVGGDSTEIEVAPTWRDEKDLIGFYNDYSKTFHATQFLVAVYRSTYKTNTMNLIVMDEINNARVEKYFAPILNQINSDKKVIDIQSNIKDDKYPLNAPFGLLDCADNNWFIGIEVRDDSKYRIPEKVYGLACVVDVRMTKVEEKVDYVKPMPMNYLSFIKAKKLALENEVIEQDEIKFIDKLCKFMNEHFVPLDRDARENKYKNFLKMFYACGGNKKIGVNKNLFSLLTSYLDDSSIAVSKKDLKFLKSRLIESSNNYDMAESIGIVDKMIESMGKE